MKFKAIKENLVAPAVEPKREVDMTKFLINQNEEELKRALSGVHADMLKDYIEKLKALLREKEGMTKEEEMELL